MQSQPPPDVYISLSAHFLQGQRPTQVVQLHTRQARSSACWARSPAKKKDAWEIFGQVPNPVPSDAQEGTRWDLWLCVRRRRSSWERRHRTCPRGSGICRGCVCGGLHTPDAKAPQMTDQGRPFGAPRRRRAGRREKLTKEGKIALSGLIVVLDSFFPQSEKSVH